MRKDASLGAARAWAPAPGAALASEAPPPRATHDTTRRVETSWRNVTPTRRASLPRLARRANTGRATRRPSRACTISCITPSSPPRREGARRAARSARRRNRAPPPAKTPPSSCSCRSPVFRVRRGCPARPARVLTSPIPRPPRANQGDAEADLPRLQDARAHRDQACVPRPRDASPTHHRRVQTASVAPWTDGATILKRFLGRARGPSDRHQSSHCAKRRPHPVSSVVFFVSAHSAPFPPDAL